MTAAHDSASDPAGDPGWVTLLPDWEQIRERRPQLRDRLRANPTDHDALVEYLQLTLGATIVDRS